MDRYNFDEEEVTHDELKSVAYTAASVMIVITSVMTWILFH